MMARTPLFVIIRYSSENNISTNLLYCDVRFKDISIPEEFQWHADNNVEELVMVIPFVSRKTSCALSI